VNPEFLKLVQELARQAHKVAVAPADHPLLELAERELSKRAWTVLGLRTDDAVAIWEAARAVLAEEEERRRLAQQEEDREIAAARAAYARRRRLNRRYRQGGA